jgi:hypothetical protein
MCCTDSTAQAPNSSPTAAEQQAKAALGLKRFAAMRCLTPPEALVLLVSEVPLRFLPLLLMVWLLLLLPSRDLLRWRLLLCWVGWR